MTGNSITNNSSIVATSFFGSQKKAGRPFIYSDEAIKARLIVRFKYQLPLRELDGLFQFLAQLMDIPNTQVCRRMRSIQLPEELMNKKKVTDLVLDTTGLKIYGEEEWCTKRYWVNPNG